MFSWSSYRTAIPQCKEKGVDNCQMETVSTRCTLHGQVLLLNGSRRLEILAAERAALPTNAANCSVSGALASERRFMS